ncbi:MAG: winged helix DNA-binding domain-containing protein [Anaerolineae bacterium]|nr:winged helix DNA-binding domain-containing protein [Anaerolineae bacterium]
MTHHRPVQVKHLRQLAITKQYLHDAPQPTFEDVTSAIGCLQLDPISAVAKSHQIVMWSRVGNYDTQALSDFIYGDKKMFEYWAHEASLVLSDDYPIYRHWMNLYPNGNVYGEGSGNAIFSWLSDLENNGVTLQHQIINRLRDEGALPSRAFESGGKGGVSTGWTGSSVLNKMIDYLWMKGHISVAKREGNQRLWDLMERCLPATQPTEALSQEDVVRLAVQKAIKALGIGTSAHIKVHFTRRRYPNMETIIHQLVTDGSLIPVTVMNDTKSMKGAYYIHKEDLSTLEHLEKGGFTPKTVLLSPFDNLICDRKRTEELFNFYYRIEIYTPQHKRQYGYYVLPILQGDRFIGRIDSVMERKTGVFTINAIYAEENAPDDANTIAQIRQTIENLGAWLGAKEIRYSDVLPTIWRGIA